MTSRIRPLTAVVLLLATAGLMDLAVDVAAASAKPIYVNCTVARQPIGSGVVHQARQHPAACELQGLPEDLADLARLTDMRWTGWAPRKR